MVFYKKKKSKGISIYLVRDYIFTWNAQNRDSPLMEENNNGNNFVNGLKES